MREMSYSLEKTNRKVICLTPVKNEAWILEIFLKATSLWADHIIISDQGSTDGSAEIAQRFEKVILVKNNSSTFNEPERQKQLLEEARKISGENNVFMALDADEILVNLFGNPEWEELKSQPPGTTIWLPWLNVLPGNQTYYGARGGGMLFGYIDDGRPHIGNPIHSPRLPSDLTEPTKGFATLKVLHFQYSARERLLSKHRWYECYEKIKFPAKNNIDIYRQYHHIDLPVSDIEKIDIKWLEHLTTHGVDITNIKDDAFHWWDRNVCELFDKYGVGYFRKQAIWYKDWKAIYKLQFPESIALHIYDPRSILDKYVHTWLAKSQHNRFSFPNKVVNKLLRIFNW
jgi:glycosyltransferase involved in cell wall biosynthesis